MTVAAASYLATCPHRGKKRPGFCLSLKSFISVSTYYETCYVSEVRSTSPVEALPPQSKAHRVLEGEQARENNLGESMGGTPHWERRVLYTGPCYQDHFIHISFIFSKS